MANQHEFDINYSPYSKENSKHPNLAPVYNNRQWVDEGGHVLNKRNNQWYPNGYGQYVNYDIGGRPWVVSEENYKLYKKASDIIRDAEKQLREIMNLNARNDELFSIPKKEKNKLVITQNVPGGLNYSRGAVVYTNLLDSLAKYGKEIGLPLLEAFGIPARESLFVARNENRNTISPTFMMSLWNNAGADSPYSSFLSTINRKYNSIPNFVSPGGLAAMQIEGEPIPISPDSPELNKFIIESYPYTQKLGEVYKNRPAMSPIKYGFLDYLSRNPNPGNKKYKEEVRLLGKEFLQSPEVIKWRETSPYAYKKGGYVVKRK